MNTLEEFENAPVGSTASGPNGRRAVRTGDRSFPWLTTWGNYNDHDEMVHLGYVLDPAIPTTAREALDLAWELAHPIKAGDVIPAGTRCIQWHKGTTHWQIYDEIRDFETDAYALDTIRTLEPLPPAVPDWLEAPAVLATHEDSYDYLDKSVWHPIRFNNKLWSSGGLTVHWYELVDVTPLYPKEGKES